MDRLNQVVVEWDDELTLILTVRLARRRGPPTGEEWRLEQEIAAHIWGAWHCAELERTGEQ